MGNKEVVATNILCLMNMITADELTDDIRNECSKYGKIRSLHIPRPSSDFQVPGVGKIFIEYFTSADCKKASEGLAGRKFANRVVVTAFYDPELYARQEFQ